MVSFLPSLAQPLSECSLCASHVPPWATARRWTQAVPAGAPRLKEVGAAGERSMGRKETHVIL